MTTDNMHIGRKISRIRELKGMKQETLAAEMGVSQQTISRLEQSEFIEDDKLQLIAEKLGVTVEAIKNFDEQKAIYNIQNNFEGSNNQGPNLNYYQCQFNPLEKYVEAMEENKKLYEKLLQAEREKNELLERMLKERK